MGDDQYRMRDPREQYRSPDEQDTGRQQTPGWTGEMDRAPTMGSGPTAALAGWSAARR